VLKSAIHSENSQGLDFELASVPSLVRARSSADELKSYIPQIINNLVKELNENKNNDVKKALMNSLSQLCHVMQN
jgi:hypothetical protein